MFPCVSLGLSGTCPNNGARFPFVTQRLNRAIRLFGPAGFVLVLRSNEKGGVYVTDPPVSVDKVALLPR